MDTWRLSSLRVKNFKYFYASKEIEANGKNLLIYGENGSGKSSIYWSLYTLLHSALKATHTDVKKYFDPSKDENLRNKNIDDANEDSYVEATWDLYNDKLKKVGANAITTKIDLNTGLTESETDFMLLTARASDFMSYKGLSHLFDFSNSKVCDWFDALRYDFFPYWRDDSFKDVDGKTFDNAELYWDYLLSIPETLPVNEGNKELNRTNERFKFLQISIDEFQTNLDIELVDIEQNANEILRDQFKIPVRIEIKAEGAGFDLAYPGHPNVHDKTIHAPKVTVTTTLLTDDFANERFIIAHPPSYFNEAKLSCLALAMRLSLMQWHINRDEGKNYSKLLCVDDLLISLDMPNREKVISILLSSLTQNFQMLMFTHDPIFYNLIKEHIKLIPKEDAKWKCLEVFATDSDLDDIKDSPVILSDVDNLERAKGYYRSKDFGSCGNYLRKECEHILCTLLPENKTLEPQNDGTIKKKDLNGLICEWKSLLDIMGTSLAATTPNLQLYRQHVWNPLSHNDLNSPIFRQELYDSIKELEELKSYVRTEPITAPYLDEPEGCKISFDVNGNNYVCKMQPFDKFYVYNIKGQDYYLDVGVVAEKYEESLGVNAPAEKPITTPKDKQTIRTVYSELLRAAGTDEQTVGKWYEWTTVGKRYQKLKI